MTTKHNTTNPIETAEQMARKIWLAGLGAYGKSFEELQNQYAKLNNTTSQYFDELVEKGAKLEAETKQRIKTEASPKKHADSLRKKLSSRDSGIEQRINELSKKVDELAVAVSKLSA